MRRAGAALAGIVRRTLIVIVAEERRSNVPPRGAHGWQRVSADDELLLVLELELSPQGRSPPREIRRGGVLENQTLPSVASRRREHAPRGRGSAARRGTQPHERARRPSEQTLEPLSTLRPWLSTQVHVAERQDVERNECGSDAARATRRTDMAILKRLKSERRSGPIDGDDLSVERHAARSRRQRCECPNHLRKFA